MSILNFTGKIIKNSKILKVHSKGKFPQIDKSHHVRIFDEVFNIEKIQNQEKWFDFKTEVGHDGDIFLVVENSKLDDIMENDTLEIIVPEFVAEEKCNVVNGGKGYGLEDVMIFEGYEGKVYIKPSKISQGGVIEEAAVITEKNFLCKDNIVTEIDGGSGDGLEIEIKLTDSNEKSMASRQVKEVIFEKKNSYIRLEYDLPQKIEKGSIKLFRTLVTFKQACLQRDYSFANCIAEKTSFTPRYKIPIVKPGTINAPLLFNEGAIIIEKKIIELENKIRELEKRI